jgi:hypothetical protein
MKFMILVKFMVAAAGSAAAMIEEVPLREPLIRPLLGNLLNGQRIVN